MYRVHTGMGTIFSHAKPGAPNSANFRGGGDCRGNQDLIKGGGGGWGCNNYLI